jgi:hypothetical protein
MGFPPSVTVPKRLRISTFEMVVPVPEMSIPNESVSSAEIAGHAMTPGDGPGGCDAEELGTAATPGGDV